jgi:hypothetical protein
MRGTEWAGIRGPGPAHPARSPAHVWVGLVVGRLDVPLDVAGVDPIAAGPAASRPCRWCRRRGRHRRRRVHLPGRPVQGIGRGRGAASDPGGPAAGGPVVTGSGGDVLCQWVLLHGDHRAGPHEEHRCPQPDEDRRTFAVTRIVVLRAGPDRDARKDRASPTPLRTSLDKPSPRSLFVIMWCPSVGGVGSMRCNAPSAQPVTCCSSASRSAPTVRPEVNRDLSSSGPLGALCECRRGPGR